MGIIQVSLNGGADFTTDNLSPIFICPVLPTIKGIKPLFGTEKGDTPLLISVKDLGDWIAASSNRNNMMSGPVLACSFSSPGDSVSITTTFLTAAVHLSEGIARCHSPPGVPGTSVEVQLVLTSDGEFKGEIIATALGMAEFSFVPSVVLSSIVSQSPLVIQGSGFLEKNSFLPSTFCCYVNDTLTYAEILSPTLIQCGLPPGWLGGPAVISVSSNGVDAESHIVIPGIPSAPTLWAVIPSRGVIGGGTRIQVLASFPNTNENNNSIDGILLLPEEEKEIFVKCKFRTAEVSATSFHVSDVSDRHVHIFNLHFKQQCHHIHSLLYLKVHCNDRVV